MIAPVQVRGLTVRQPWADAITHGSKRIENRNWSTRYRGLVLIHAAARYAEQVIGDHALGDHGPGDDVRSAVLATARLVDVHPEDGCCREWGHVGVHHWRLEDVRPLPEPVPCKGSLGLWTPSADLLRKAGLA